MNEETLKQYLADVNLEWHQASLKQKEFALHEYLNLECSAGIFTNQVEPHSIKISLDSSREITIDTTETLESIEAKLDSFLAEIGGKS